MTPKKLAIAWVGFIVVAFVAGWFVSSCVKAHADTQDQIFVTRLTEAGFSINGSMQAVIREARSGCAVALLTRNPHKIADVIWASEPQLSFFSVGQAAQIAAEVYCPAVLFFQSGVST